MLNNRPSEKTRSMKTDAINNLQTRRNSRLTCGRPQVLSSISMGVMSGRNCIGSIDAMPARSATMRSGRRNSDMRRLRMQSTYCCRFSQLRVGDRRNYYMEMYQDLFQLKTGAKTEDRLHARITCYLPIGSKHGQTISL